MISGSSFFPLLLSLLFLLTAIPWYIGVRRGGLDPFEPIVFKSVFVAMMGIVLFDRVYLQDPHFGYDVITGGFTELFSLVALLYVVLFMSILVGYYSPIGNRAISARGRFDPGQYRVKQVRLVALVYVGIGAVAYVALILLAIPGLDVFYLYTTTTPRSQIFADYQVFAAISQLSYIGYFLWLTCSIATFETARARDLAGLPVLLFMFLLLGGRSTVMTILFTVVIMYYYGFRFGLLQVRNPRLKAVAEAPQSIKVSGIGIGGLTAAAFVPIARHLRRGQGPLEAIERTNFVSIFTSGVHADTPDALLALIEVVPGEFGYFYGSTYLRVLTNFVPRAIWDGKPVLTTGGVLRRAILPDSSGGRDPGEIGTYIVNFGYPGIVLLGGIFGVLARILYETLLENRRSPLVILLYAFLLISVVRTGLVNNSLFNVVIFFLTLSPVVAIHLPQIDPVLSKVRIVVSSFLE